MSLNIDPQVEQDLITLAAREKTSISILLSEFTEQKKRYWQEYEEDRAALEAMKNGEYIEHDAMLQWLDDLDNGLNV